MDRPPLPHDLLWGLTPAALPAEVPGWARAVAAASLPVVVRRAPAVQGAIAVGLRGRTRAERLSTWLPVAALQRRVAPETLRPLADCRDLPALETLAALQTRLDVLALPWGPTGATGYELACGQAALHAASDLDLVLRYALPLARPQARELLADLQGSARCRLDIQLETPYGAVALADWAGTTTRVLLKTATRPCLVSDPWALERAA